MRASQCEALLRRALTGPTQTAEPQVCGLDPGHCPVRSCAASVVLYRAQLPAEPAAAPTFAKYAPQSALLWQASQHWAMVRSLRVRIGITPLP